MNITQLVTGPLGVNTWFLPLDGVSLVVVDPGGNPELIIAHMEALHLRPALILLTHGHFDHLVALPALAAAFPGVPVAIHPADAAFLGSGALSRHRSFFARLGAAELVDAYPEELPSASLLLAEGQDLWGWKVMHTPGHSRGSVCLHNPASGILVSGDTLFRDGAGRTDCSGGSSAELSESLRRLSLLPAETLVLPGHGDRTTIGREFGR